MPMPQPDERRDSPKLRGERDFEELLDRLQNLGGLVPRFAQGLGKPTGQAARLRLRNGRLLEQVRRLQRVSREGARSGARVGHRPRAANVGAGQTKKGVGDAQHAH
jgi:hypothetical protein